MFVMEEVETFLAIARSGSLAQAARLVPLRSRPSAIGWNAWKNALATPSCCGPAAPAAPS
jgi:hypothetical protein